MWRKCSTIFHLSFPPLITHLRQQFNIRFFFLSFFLSSLHKHNLFLCERVLTQIALCLLASFTFQRMHTQSTPLCLAWLCYCAPLYHYVYVENPRWLVTRRNLKYNNNVFESYYLSPVRFPCHLIGAFPCLAPLCACLTTTFTYLLFFQFPIHLQTQLHTLLCVGALLWWNIFYRSIL